MENILTKDEYILFDDEEGLVITNKKIVIAERDSVQINYNCYPLSSIIKFVIITSKNLKVLSIKLENITIDIDSNSCNKILEIHECILNA